MSNYFGSSNLYSFEFWNVANLEAVDFDIYSDGDLFIV